MSGKQDISGFGIHLLYHHHNCELRRVSSFQCAYTLQLDETNPSYEKNHSTAVLWFFK